MANIVYKRLRNHKASFCFVLLVSIITGCSPAPIKEPTKEELEYFRLARSVCLVFKGHHDSDLEDDVQRLLEYADVKVLNKPSSKDCDATLEIQTDANLEKFYYYDRDTLASRSGYYYTGANVQMKISFIMPGKAPFQKSFSKRIVPPSALSIFESEFYSTESSQEYLDKELDRKTHSVIYDFPVYPQDFSGRFFWFDMFELIFGIYGSAPIVRIYQSYQEFSPRSIHNTSAFFLAKIGEITPLIEALNNKNPGVREVAAMTLGCSKDYQAVPALIEAAKDNDRNVRTYVAGALGRIGGEEAIVQLISFLNDNEIMVRIQAIRELHQLKSKKAVKYLIPILDKDDDAKHYAIRALKDITGMNCGESRDAWENCLGFR